MLTISSSFTEKWGWGKIRADLKDWRSDQSTLKCIIFSSATPKTAKLKLDFSINWSINNMFLDSVLLFKFQLNCNFDLIRFSSVLPLKRYLYGKCIKWPIDQSVKFEGSTTTSTTYTYYTYSAPKISAISPASPKQNYIYFRLIQSNNLVLSRKSLSKKHCGTGSTQLFCPGNVLKQKQTKNLMVLGPLSCASQWTKSTT